MSYENIVEAGKRRDAKAKAGLRLERQKRAQGRKRDHFIDQEKDEAEVEIRKLGLDKYYTILKF